MKRSSESAVGSTDAPVLDDVAQFENRINRDVSSLNRTKTLAVIDTL